MADCPRNAVGGSRRLRVEYLTSGNKESKSAVPVPEKEKVGARREVKMSGLLAGKIWQSGLDPHLKPLAAALADIANDDGTSIYPSVAYVAWLLGRSERSVQTGLAELRKSCVLKVVAYRYGGRGNTTEYRLIEDNLPKRASWKQYRAQKGAAFAPFADVVKGEPDATNGEASDCETVQASKAKDEGGCTPPVNEPSKNRDEPSEKNAPQNPLGLKGRVSEGMSATGADLKSAQPIATHETHLTREERHWLESTFGDVDKI